MRIVQACVAALIASSFIAGSAAAQTANAGASSGSQSQSGSIAGSQASGNSINIQSGRSYRNTGAAFAPSLAVGGFSCQGSVSAGAGGAGWGVAFGTTVMDRDCNTRENAKVAAAAFGIGVGRSVLCYIDQIRAVAPQCGGGQVANRPAARPRTLFGYMAPREPVAAIQAASVRPAKPRALTANQIGAKQAAARIQAKIAARELAAR